MEGRLCEVARPMSLLKRTPAATAYDPAGDCDRLILSLDGQIVNLEVAARAQLADLPDRRYYLRGSALWWEVKGPGDKASRTKPDRLSPGQFTFLMREWTFGAAAGAGDVTQLARVVVDRPPSQWLDAAFAELGVIVARGPR